MPSLDPRAARWVAIAPLLLAGCVTEVAWQVELECSSAEAATTWAWAITSGTCAPPAGEIVATGIVGEDEFDGTLGPGRYCFWTLGLEESPADDSCQLVALSATARELPSDGGAADEPIACVDESVRPTWDSLVEAVSSCAPARHEDRCLCPGSEAEADRSCVPPLAVDFLAVASDHVCVGARGARSLWCWGERTGFTRSGEGRTDLPMAVGLVPGDDRLPWLVDAGAGRGVTCALDAVGLLHCEGERTADWPDPVRLLADSDGELSLVAQRLSVGDGFACAVGNSRFEIDEPVVACWGVGDEGQLGRGVEPAQPIAAVLDIGALRPEEVAAGRAHACLLSAGEILCWGANAEGQADPSAPGGVIAPTRVAPPRVGGSLSPWIGVAAGGDRTCARDAEASIHCWGADLPGVQCVAGGCGSGEGGNFVALTVSETHACAAFALTQEFFCLDFEGAASTPPAGQSDPVVGFDRLLAGPGLACGLLDGSGIPACRSLPADAVSPLAGTRHAREGSGVVCP